MTKTLICLVFVSLLLSMTFYTQSTADVPYEAPEAIQPAPEVEIEPKTVRIKVIPTKPTTTRELIEWYADKHGAPQDQAYWIAQCESQLINQCNRDSCTFGIGIYQFIQSTWDSLCEGDVNNIEDNINCGTRLIGEGKLSHWGTQSTSWGSYACWAPHI